jgi:voltage-gated potassium channel
VPLLTAGVPAVLFFAGVYGYMAVEGWGTSKASTCSTSPWQPWAFEEVRHLSDDGMVLNSVLNLLGVGNFEFLFGPSPRF